MEELIELIADVILTIIDSSANKKQLLIIFIVCTIITCGLIVYFI